MELMIVGVNYRTAPVEIREQLSFAQPELLAAMQTLNEEEAILENIILSTCNRTEIYIVASCYESGMRAVTTFMSKWFSLPLETFESYLFVKSNEEMIEHLLTVTSGIDSMVLGETQILGQIRQSFLQAQSIGTSYKIFNRLFKEAITFAKKMHQTTNIASNAVSIAYATVQLIDQTVERLKNQRIVILGAGEMGELSLKHLRALGVNHITLISRTYATAKNRADQYGVEAKPLELLGSALVDADILISSTSANEVVLDEGLMKEVMASREQRSIHLFDIAVPRDIDERIRHLENVFVYDIDHLQHIVDANFAEREKAAHTIRQMIEIEVAEFTEWLMTMRAFPTIEAVSKKAKVIQQSTLQSMYNKMPDLTDREKNIIDDHTRSIVNQLLKEAIHTMKDVTLTEESDASLQLIQQLFDVEKDVQGLAIYEQLSESTARRVSAKESESSLEICK